MTQRIVMTTAAGVPVADNQNSPRRRASKKPPDRRL